MKQSSKTSLFVAALVSLVLGVALAVYAQSVSMARLAEDKAGISKMDWILLNTRVHVLEQALKDDLAVPLVATAYSFDAEKQQVAISVFVSPAWLGKADFQAVNKALSARALALCVAPALAQRGEYLASMMFAPGKPPKDYCSIRFFTHSLDRLGNLTVRDVALYEAGQLVVK